MSEETRRKNAERRKKIREDLTAAKAREQAKWEEAQKTPSPEKGHFIGKCRRGDALTIEFQFSGLPVPYEDEKDPDAGIVERTEALRDDINKAKKNKPS